MERRVDSADTRSVSKVFWLVTGAGYGWTRVLPCSVAGHCSSDVCGILQAMLLDLRSLAKI